MAQRRRDTPSRAPAAKRLILDAGAVIALSRDDDRARAVLAAARESRIPVTIPAVVIAETVRGGRGDATVNRVVKAVGAVAVTDERVGRTAGGLLGAAGSDATIDAVVIATAIEAGGAVVLTGDPDDLGRLAAGHPEVQVQAL